jgi:hypothetical protein
LILEGKHKGYNDVQHNEEEVAYRNSLNELVMRHELGIFVEGFAIVRQEQLQVAYQVDSKKKDKEKPCESHEQFSSYGTA